MTEEKFLKLIDSKKDLVNKIEKIKGDKLPVIMWGAGSLAHSVYKMLNKNGVKIAAVLVDGKDDSEEFFAENIPIINGRQMCEDYAKVNVVLGHSRYDLKDKVKENYQNVNQVFYFCNICYEQYDPVLCEDIKRDIDDYLYAYNRLEDEESKKCMIAYLNSRMNDKIEYIIPCVNEKSSYFKNELFECNDRECYLDLGAYTGDTIEEFLNAVDGEYNEIIAFEPEEDSFSILEKYVKDKQLRDVSLFKLGCYNEKARLYFYEKEESSGITLEESDSFIDVIDMDSCIGDKKVSMVKINYLYGVKETLEGMKRLLKENMPKVAVTVGFDKKTFVEVIRFFTDLEVKEGEEYKFILRYNAVMPSRLVFYACKK